jgi:hypothetical protein
MATTPLTAAARKRITEDWKNAFPNLGVYKPMWLMKRNGPLLMGICLDRTRSNDVYIPKFHVHDLISTFPGISLMLYHAVPDERQPRMPRQIRVDRHEVMSVAAMASLKSLVPEISQQDVSLSRILRMYREDLDKNYRGLAKYPEWMFMDVILLAFWSGYHDYARTVLDGACEVMRFWPARGLPLKPFDVSAWRDGVETQLCRNRMASTLKEQIMKHKVAHLPVYELVADEPPEPNIVEVYKTLLSQS